MVIMKVKVISSEPEVQRTPSLPRTGSLYKFKFISEHQPKLHLEIFLQVVSVFYWHLQKFDIIKVWFLPLYEIEYVIN